MSAIIAKKRFGQHFLNDNRLVQKMVDALHLEASQSVLEIGPGPGILTRALLAEIPVLHAIEIDRDLCQILQAEFSSEQLRLINQDVLSVDFNTLVCRPPLRIVGNLPYNISTPLLFKLLGQAELIADMHFMLQKEVVERICAKPNTKAFGRLSVMVQYFCEVKSLWTVKPSSFSPPPKVDSAVIRLIPRPFSLECLQTAALEHIVKYAFQQRRKTLLNALKGIVDKSMIELAGINPSLRAEALSVEDFVRLANVFSEQGVVSQ